MLGLLGVVYQRLSLFIILSMSGSTLTGYYSASARVVEAAKVGHVAVFTALYPLMARMNPLGKLNWIRTFRFPLILLVGGAIIASMILSSLAKTFIDILFGAGYLNSASPLQVLAWILLPYTINSFLSLAYLAEGDSTTIILALIIGIFTLTFLTVWWVPQLNLKGAALAALSSEILQSIILVGREFLRHPKKDKNNVFDFSNPF
jgi:O-antigen/teichoic acid export membrane protein